MGPSDRAQVRLAMEEDRALLTSGGGLLERAPVRDVEGASLLAPHAPVE